MDTVTVQGEKYTKTAVLAKEFGYTTDYLGQLCREEKVDAELVGRAWYIKRDSLLEYRDSRYQNSSIGYASTEQSHSKKSVPIEPQIDHKTLRIINNISEKQASNLPPKYETDDQSLLPEVRKEVVGSSKAGEPDLSERVDETHESAEVTIRITTPEAPERAKKGSLGAITIKSDEDTEGVPLSVLIKEKRPSSPRVRQSDINSSEYVEKHSHTEQQKQIIVAKEVENDAVEPLSFTPKTVTKQPKKRPTNRKSRPLKRERAAGTSKSPVVLPLALVSIAFLLSAALLSTENIITTFGSNDRSVFELQPASLIEVYERVVEQF